MASRATHRNTPLTLNDGAGVGGRRSTQGGGRGGGVRVVDDANVFDTGKRPDRRSIRQSVGPSFGRSVQH